MRPCFRQKDEGLALRLAGRCGFEVLIRPISRKTTENLRCQVGHSLHGDVPSFGGIPSFFLLVAVHSRLPCSVSQRPICSPTGPSRSVALASTRHGEGTGDNRNVACRSPRRSAALPMNLPWTFRGLNSDCTCCNSLSDLQLVHDFFLLVAAAIGYGPRPSARKVPNGHACNFQRHLIG